jgi:hypothetical protein
VSVLAVLVAAPLAYATVSKSSPGLSKVKWRLVVRSVLIDFTKANDRYVAFLHGSSFPGRLTLIDEQTGRGKQLSGPNCANPAPHVFGGPWLMVTCFTPLTPAAYQLYDLSSGRWVAFQVSSQCRGGCEPVAVGRYWVKIVSDEGEPEGYPVADYYLQNIATGQFEPDPATPSGAVFDDLNAASGSVPLCPPLQYPSVDAREGIFLGQLTFYRRFAVTDGSPGVWSLRRCGSRLDLKIAGPTDGYAPVASSRAVVTTRDGFTFHGWFLPSLRRFTIRGRPRFGSLSAVTARTIYIDSNSRLWAATLPAPHPRLRH